MGRRTWKRVTPEARREIFRLSARGESARAVTVLVGRSKGSVDAVLRPSGGVIRQEDWRPPKGRGGLTLDDRAEIHAGVARGESYARIGCRLGRHRSSIWREVTANGGPQGYLPLAAQRRAQERARRPKATKLAANPELCARVIADLEWLCSPQQISHRLQMEFPDNPDMRVSPETIYKSIYVQGRGELRRELARCLRTGRAQRRRSGRLERRGQIPDMVTISERPAEVADRAVPGHWEGDLIIGKGGASAIGTLVERSTRFVMLLHLPDGHGADAVRNAMTAIISELPDALWRSITWDRGKEMAQHARFSIDTGIDIYFCDPHAPWQRGTNENTNGLLRQYFPKGTDLSTHDADHLRTVSDSLNRRPRQTLGWLTPSEKLAEHVASTG